MKCSRNVSVFLAVLGLSCWSAESFVPAAPPSRKTAGRSSFGARRHRSYPSAPLCAAGSEDADDAEVSENETAAASGEEEPADDDDVAASSDERESLKRSLLKLAAAYDRGYGSTASSRKKVDDVIDRLESLNPTADAARGISGDGGIGGAYEAKAKAPLAGIWRMCWTTAQDVLTLAASPFVTVGSIYQVIEPPVATNVIDFIPRAQALLPPGVAPPTLLRAEVTTRASPREGKPLRVGLDFEAVKLNPVEVLGFATDGVLPPLSFNLPRISVADLPGVDPDNSPGYFDVAYLDDEMLIIRQNAPGGLFVLLKADNYDP